MVSRADAQRVVQVHVGGIFPPGCPTQMARVDAPSMPSAATMRGLMPGLRWCAMCQLTHNPGSDSTATLPAQLPVTVSVLFVGPDQAVVTITGQRHFHKSPRRSVWRLARQRVSVEAPTLIVGNTEAGRGSGRLTASGNRADRNSRHDRRRCTMRIAMATITTVMSITKAKGVARARSQSTQVGVALMSLLS